MNYFTKDEEKSILAKLNGELLLNKLISPWLRRYPILLYYNVDVINADALNYLYKKFDKYDVYQTSNNDKLYDFCVKKLGNYARQLLKQK